MGTSAVETAVAAAAAGFDPLPTATTAVVQTPLTDAERLTRLEGILRDYIQNPPKLPDGEILGNRIGAVDGKADAALRQIASMSDSLPGRVQLLEQRLGIVETNVATVAADKGVGLIVPVYDEAHQTATRDRIFKCHACGTGFSDTVPANAVINNQRPCPSCGTSVTAS